MDLNIKSPLVWEFYAEVLKKLASYGCKIVRLDAFAYAPKEAGKRNFLNDPGTWDLLEKIREMADGYGLRLLPEIHATYQEKLHEQLANKGYMIYDFFLPGLLIDALENKNLDKIIAWAKELKDKKMMAVNMLGCHDGIPLLDLKGLLADDEIQGLIDIIVKRGGHIKNLHGQKDLYYQVNATYYSALGEDDDKMILARALQLFMPGKPQVWYLDLFAGKNDYEGMRRAGSDGHKEINRTNLATLQVKEAMEKRVVRQQIKMLRFRKEFPAFNIDAEFTVENNHPAVIFKWESGAYKAILKVDISTCQYEILGFENTVCVFKLRS
jgi:sucrose phosphorylase